MSFWNNIQKTLQSFGATANAVFGSGGVFKNLNPMNVVNNLGNKYLGTGLTDAEKEANEFSAGEAEKAREHDIFMASNQHQMEVQDYLKAGINPMMAAGGSGASVSGAHASSVSPSGSGGLGELLQLATLKPQIDVMKAQAENLRAGAKDKETHAGVNTQQVEQIKQNIEESKARINELASRTDLNYSETDLNFVRGLELQSSINLNNVTAENMEALRQSQIALNEARTTEAKAQASLAYWNTMYQKGLIDAGMCEKVAGKIAAETRLADSQGHMMDEQATKTAIENSIKSGKWSTTMSSEGDGFDRFVMHFDRVTSIIGNVLSLSN